MGKVLIKGGLIIPMTAGMPDVVSGDLLIDGGRIAAMGDGLSDPDAEIVDATRRIVIPGLVNAHMHTWQTALRGIAGDWTVPQYMRAMHRGLATHFGPDDIRIANLFGSLNQLNSGCTTLVDWCHNNPTPDHTDAAIDGLEAAGIRAVFLHGSPKPDPKPGEKHFSEVPMPRREVERLRRGRLGSDEALVTMGLAILGPAYSTYEVTEHDIGLGREYGFVTSMHVGGGPMLSPDGFERLLAAGLIDRRVNVVHGNNLSDATLHGLLQAGATFTITADVELQMGFGHPVTGRVRAHGAPLSIGIDVEPAIAGDLFTTMRTTLQAQRNLDNLAAIQRGETVPDTTTIPCREALAWATINGAQMIGQDERIGSLAVGKQADVVLLRTDDLNLFPVHDPISSVVLQAGVQNVDTVIVAGQFMKRDGALLRTDLHELRESLVASGRRILRDIGMLRAA